MAEPITPDQVVQAQIAAIPDEVIEAFNELIAKAWDGHQAIVRQPDAVEAILDRGTQITRGQIFDDRLLNVEPIYRGAGWTVAYEKPGFNEAGNAYFTFSLPDGY